MPGDHRDSRFCKEKLARLLEPFFTPKSTARGIGLGICQTSIVAHGGRLTAKNIPNRVQRWVSGSDEPVTKSRNLHDRRNRHPSQDRRPASAAADCLLWWMTTCRFSALSRLLRAADY
jgi:hypothetical protein